MTIETKAARLVAALERSGVKVASVTINGDEIKVTLRGSEEPEISPVDLIQWGKR